MVRIEGLSRADFGCSILKNRGVKMIDICKKGKVDLYSDNGHFWLPFVDEKCMHCGEYKNYGRDDCVKNENITVFWEVHLDNKYGYKTRGFGSLKDAQEYVAKSKAQENCCEKIFNIIKEEIRSV
jgi:hypothetical protein